MSHAMNVGPLDDPYIGAIEWGGFVWTDTDQFRAPVTISYFLANDHSSWTSVEANAIANGLQSWANVANITFYQAENAASADLIEHSVSGSVLDGDYGLHGTPEDAFQTTDQFDGDLLVGGRTYAHGYFNYESFGWDYYNPNGGLSVGGNGYWTLIHELGHGLGLAHPHDDGGGSGQFPGVTGPWVTGDNGLNQGIWTVMSYIGTTGPGSANTNYSGADDTWNDAAGNEVATYGYYAGPMAFDIAAIQDLYGANTTYRNGSDVYYLPDQDGVGTYWTCIWDTGGNDSIAYSGSRNVTINLTAATLDNSPTGGGVLSSAAGIHGGYTIANGVVIENAYSGNGNDKLTGNSTGNILNGGAGADTMTGGGGGDTYYVDNVGDVVIENGGGTDWVYTYLTYYALGANVENLNYIGNFSTGFTGIGNSLGNTISGYHGNDYLDGGGGADVLHGHNGDDTYVIENVGDVILESANAGNDWVNCYLTSYTLGANVENINYLGTSTANFTAFGNALNNTILAWNGNDYLDGGAGADRLEGYAGDDTFVVDNIGDVVVEYANAGNDWVYCYLPSYTLGADVENVNYLGTSTANFSVTGNDLANYIIGWNGNDELQGGAGADTLSGYNGNDTIGGGEQGDVIYGDGGNDLINGGMGLDTIDGGAGDDTINGGVGSDAIFGGSGFDQIFGGDGNDTLNGGDQGDLVFGDLGNDIIGGGMGLDTIDGGAGNDTITGGAGSDQLSGGADADTFVFNLPGAANDSVDSILDFSIGADVIQVSANGYGGGLLPGSSATVFNVTDPTALTASGAHFIFDTDDHALWWDSTGGGATDAVEIAILTGVSSLHSTDLIVV